VCSATVMIYNDSLCMMLEAGGPLTANQTLCLTVDEGIELRGKTVTKPSYEPGLCKPIGGAPVGSVELTGPSTFCCQ
jgi:hypothetical protein